MAIKIEHYLSHTDYPIWQVIQNGNGPVSVTTNTNGMINVLPPKTAEEVVARERERKNSIRWLMQKRCGKLSNQEGLHKGYDRAKGNQDSRRRDVRYNGNKTRDNGRRPAYHDDSKGLVTIDGEDIDWSGHSVFMNKVSDLEDTSVNDRYVDGMHAVPPPMTGNYMPSGLGVKIDYSIFTYGPKQTLDDELDSKPSEYASCESDSKDKEKPSFAFTDSVKHVKTSMENVKETGTPNHSPKAEQQDRNGPTRKGLGYALTRKACFICGSFSHLIRDCNFHEKRMVKQAELTKSKNKDNPRRALKDKGIIDSGCSRYMTRNKAYLTDYQEFKGSSVAFGGSNERITGKGKIKAGKLKGIKREYSNARTPQQNRVPERKNMTLIEAAKTMVLLTKPQNKTPYEILTGKQPIISYLRPFGCHVTILNTIDQLGKFDGKSDSGFSVGYSLNSKAFRVYNLETKRVEENPYVNFLENKPNVVGKGHAWMFDLNYLANSMNFEHISVENQANKSVGLKEANNSASTQANDDQRDKIEKNTDFQTCEKPVSQVEQIFLEELEKLKRQEKEANDASESLRKDATHDLQNANTSSTNLLNTVSTPLITAGSSRAFNDGALSYPNDHLMPHLEDIYTSPSEGIFTDPSYDDEGVSWCDEFEELMKNRFQMSSMSELIFFLGLQVKQKEDGIFISRDEYVAEILKKFDFLNVKTASTPIETQKPLVKDEEAADVDVSGHSKDFKPLNYEENV
nr:retrovirus-related Pol polyprotein from transposon TNT 1-94 [Tanacetum cinerariifolium]